MADHNKPTLSDNYTDVLGSLDSRLKDQAAAFDPAKVSPTNVPANAVRWSSASKKWQIWTGTAWNDLAESYSINITGSAATLTTARTIALSGGAIGTATAFNGAANISIPVTSLDASMLTGRVPNSAAPVAAITGTGDLTGGGDLTANRTLDLTAEAKANLSKASGAVQSDGSVTMTGNLKIGTATYQSDGNIQGTVWGGNLNTYIATQLAGKQNTGNYLVLGVDNNATKTTLNSGSPPSINNINSSGNARNVALMVRNDANNYASAVMGFLREGQYGCYLGIDTDNKFKVGGWSMGNVSYQVLHEGNFPSWYGSQGAWGVGTYTIYEPGGNHPAYGPGSTLAPSGWAGTWRWMSATADVNVNKLGLILRIA